MDYKQEFLKLKQIIMENNQNGSSNLNPLFVNELSNLSFVVGNNILGDDVHAVILSLVEEFNRIAINNLKHNLELSQYYAVGKGLMAESGMIYCENCEIVLKYIDTTVCLSQGRARLHVSKDDNIPHHNNKVDCNASRGIVRFYVKQKEGSTYKYTNIHTVRVLHGKTLQPYIHTLYQDNDEISKLEDATNIAINRGQSGAILESAASGNLQANNASAVACAIHTVNNIVAETKKAAMPSQLTKMTNGRILTMVPNQTAINSAQIVAKNIMNTNTAKEKNLTAIIVPGNEPIPIQADPMVKTIPAMVDATGTKISDIDLSKVSTTINSKATNSRAALAVDANLAVVPADKVISDKTISVAQPKTPSFINNLALWASQALSAAKDTLKETSTSTIVPVSQDLSVMTPLTEQDAVKQTIQPLSRNTVSSQKTLVRRFEDKLMNDGTTPINITQTKQALAIVNNGNAQRTKQIKMGPNIDLQQKPEVTIERLGPENRHTELAESLVLSDVHPGMAPTKQYTSKPSIY